MVTVAAAGVANRKPTEFVHNVIPVPTLGNHPRTLFRQTVSHSWRNRRTAESGTPERRLCVLGFCCEDANV